MSATSPTKEGGAGLAVPPLRIFVLWHPDTKDLKGLQDLANEIVTLFNRDGTELQEGLKIRVDLRSVPFRGRADGLPREIDSGLADKTIIIPLIDDKMMLDRKWGKWIRELLSRNGFVSFPVAISENAATWKQAFPDEQGLQMPRLYLESLAARAGVLKRRLMIFCAALLSNRNPSLFISYHGESRGNEIAERIHNAVESHCPGFEPFYAHRTLRDGAPFNQIIPKKLQNASVMISILTSSYCDRWSCRDEVIGAKNPREVAEGSSVWEITPLVLIDALEGNCRSLLREFGGSRVFRWDLDRSKRESKEELEKSNEKSELAFEIIDHALIEAVISAYHRRWAEKLAGNGREVINWVPDATSLMKLRALGRLAGACTVVYPGYGLPSADKNVFEAAFNGVTFSRFEDVTES